MLINKNIPGLFNGVSQQAPTLRLDSQCEVQENALSSLIEGLTKRPPAEFVSLLNSSASNGSFIHTIDRDENEKYIVIITTNENEPIEIYKTDGTKCLVRYGWLDKDLNFTEDLTIKNYLNSINPRESFRAVTIADYTIITNRDKQCIMAETISPSYPPTAMVYVSRAIGGITYKVFIDGREVASYKTPDNLSSYSTHAIAEQLYLSLINNLQASGSNCLAITVPTGIGWSAGTGDPTAQPPAGSYFKVYLEDILNPPTLNLAANVEYVWVVAYSNEYETAFTIDTATTATNLYNDLLNNTNPEEYSITKIDNTIYIRRTNGASFNSSVDGGYAATITKTQGDNPWCVEYFSGNEFITISRFDSLDFKFKVTDDWGEQALLGIKGKTQSFSNLPPKAKDGFIVEITGDSNNKFDNYYVKFQTNDNKEPGVWVETIKPGIKTRILETSMPHRLVRTGINQFTFAPILWEPRKVGDEISAPEPSFIGNNIEDVFFFKNRLGFLSKDNVIMSKAGDYFNFFPTTALDILDDDPIDVASSSVTEVCNLFATCPINSNLLLFSQNRQFILSSSGTILTPKTVAIDPTTSYDVSDLCKPVAAGSDVYFVVPNGNFSSVFEYFVQPDGLTYDADNVTSHVPQYIPKNVIVMTSSVIHNLLFLLSSEDIRTLYVYKYFWNGDRKVQSSWSKWVLDSNILNITIMDNYLYLIVEKDAEISLLKINLEHTATDNLPFTIHLDSLVKLTGVYDQITDKTVWTLPYHDSSDNFEVIESVNGNRLSGVVKTSLNTLEIKGNYSSVPCYIGKRYKRRFRFSEWFIRNNDGTAFLEGRLQIRFLTLAFTNTGNFTLEVTPLNRSTKYYTYSPMTVGVSKSGKPVLETGKKRFLIMSNAEGCIIEIADDSYLPSSFQSADFIGFFESQSRTI